MKTQEHLHPLLEEFLSTGRLGPIVSGQSSPEYVHKLLGQPDDVSVQKNPLIWKYLDINSALSKLDSKRAPNTPSHLEFQAQLQFSFYQRPGSKSAVLSTLAILPTVSGPGFPGLITSNAEAIRFVDFISVLDRLNLSYASDDPNENPASDSQVIDGEVICPSPRSVELRSGVKLVFLDDRLQSAVISAKSKPTVKQVTLFIPEDVLEQARKLASEEKGASVASICSRWLVEHVRSLESIQS